VNQFDKIILQQIWTCK